MRPDSETVVLGLKVQRAFHDFCLTQFVPPSDASNEAHAECWKEASKFLSRFSANEKDAFHALGHHRYACGFGNVPFSLKAGETRSFLTIPRARFTANRLIIPSSLATDVEVVSIRIVRHARLWHKEPAEPEEIIATGLPKPARMFTELFNAFPGILLQETEIAGDDTEHREDTIALELRNTGHRVVEGFVPTLLGTARR